MKTMFRKLVCIAAAVVLTAGLLSPAVYGLRRYDACAQDFPEFSALAHTQTDAAENAVIVKTDGTLPDFRLLHPLSSVQGPDDTYVVTFSTASEAQRAQPQLCALHGVEYAEPNAKVYAQGGEEAITAYQTWGMDFMQAGQFAAALASQDDLQQVVVGVVDSGIKADEPIFRDRLLEGASMNGEDYTQDDYGHGTSVAGVTADCTQGLPVKILPVKVLRADGTGTLLDAANGVKYAVENGASIVNLSFVTTTCSRTLHDAVDFAVAHGALPVISAGNYALNMDKKDCCPADYAPGFVVSGCDRTGAFYTSSCYGSTVDLCAPAVNVPVTTIYGQVLEINGTSFAAPHISALAALYKLYMPDADLRALEKMLKLNTKDLDDPGFDVRYGHGVPDLSALDGSRHASSGRTVRDVRVEHLPDKTTYFYTEPFSADGLVLLITYTDGTQETRTTQGVQLVGTDYLPYGKNTIRAVYDGHEAAFDIQVKYRWWQWLIVIFLFGWVWY